MEPFLSNLRVEVKENYYDPTEYPNSILKAQTLSDSGDEKKQLESHRKKDVEGISRASYERIGDEFSSVLTINQHS